MALRLLIDEDLPRSLAPLLASSGFDSLDVRDASLRGAPDSEVFRYARSEGRILVSGDLGFSNVLTFPLGSHSGIVVARLPNELPTERGNQLILAALQAVTEDEIDGGLLIVEPGRIRLRPA